MAASINASTSAGVVTTADTSGNLNLQSGGTTIVALTSAGAAVTGTLSASGAATLSSTLGVTGAATLSSTLSAGATTITGGLSTTGQALLGGASISSGANALYGANANGVNFSRNTSTAGGKYWSFGPDNGNNFVVFNQTPAGVYVTDGGTSWTAFSDERFKDIIEPITDAALKVSALRSVIGKYKTDTVDTRRSFVIAQDVQKVLPEAVDAQNPDRLGVQYSDLIPLLIAAINELTARIAVLEAK